MKDNVLSLPSVRPKPTNTEHFSYIKLPPFTPEYEAEVRIQTADFKETKPLLPQDRLTYVFATINPRTGAAFEFGWASGRRDARATLDISFDAMVFAHGYERALELVEERQAWIATLKEKYNDTGFAHTEYEGGFEEFALNFERATGRRVAPEIDALLTVKCSQTA